jgi:hypothetical protein
MEFLDFTNPHRKSGGMGHPMVVARTEVALMAVPFRPRVLEQLSFATAPAL